MSSSLQAIRKANINSSSFDTYTIPISNSTALRVYSSTKPHNWKIAGLQKGLTLIHNGTEMIGEGTGFGLPVLVYSDETYFSATSKVCLSQCNNYWTIRKEFIIDRMARNRFRNITLENRAARALFASLAGMYQRHRHFRFLKLKSLTGKMHVEAAFVKAMSMGRVTVTYTIVGRRIRVRVDFKNLKRRNLQKIFILNEQGSRFFRKYNDSRGIELMDEKIGAWEIINTEWASLTVPHSGFGFRLWKVDKAILRTGREFLKDSLDWVGLDYETSPATSVFEYLIEIVGV